MVMVGEKNRTLVDQVVVKKEPDQNRHRAGDRHDDILYITPWDYDDDEAEEHLTLAQLSKSPNPKSASASASTTDKLNKRMENKKRNLGSPRRHWDSVAKQVAASSNAGKSPSPKKFAIDGTSSRGEFQSSALLRAEEVQLNLEPEFPSFVKSLVRSHVASCFWMGLPGLFCKRHLPDKDITMTLEDESGKEYKVKYIAYKTGLSAGWRQFSVVHKLQEGDVLIFQLVEPAKFKVYVIRANDLCELDGALSLLHLESHTKQRYGDQDNARTDAAVCSSSKRKPAKSPSSQAVQKKKKTVLATLSPKIRCSAEQSENDSEEVGSEVLEDSKPMLQFKDVKNFENFRILIHGMLIDSELPDDIRIKYYKLCHSQNAFLHDNLIEGMNSLLLGGIIAETVYIADAIKSSTPTTSRVEFTKWDKTLMGFEHLGMNVNFLRQRIRRLVSIPYETNGASDARRFLESRTELTRVDAEINNIEAKLEELKGACDGFGAYLGSLKYKTERCQRKFHQEVTAPW